MKRLLFFFCVLVLSTSAIQAAKSTFSDQIKRLQSKKPNVQEKALVELKTQHNQVVDATITQLTKNLENPKLAKRQLVTLLTETLADWKAEQAIDVLIRYIDYRIENDSQEQQALGHEFPCSLALIRIGGQKTIAAVIQATALEFQIERKRLLTWVLYNIVGMDMGMHYLEREAAKRKGREAERLIAAKKGLSEGDQILKPLTGQDADRGVARQEKAVKLKCKLSQKDIFDIIKHDMPFWKRCVEELIEKGADQVPNSLRLSFVISNQGTLSQFQILNRHLSRGPFKQCLSRYFTTLHFPESTGSNCKIDDWAIPLKH